MLCSKESRNLVLIGLMGAGKTEVGRWLADKTGRRLTDTDDVITTRLGMEVKQVFKLYGEAFFREEERKVMCELSSQEGLVIATGGGVVLEDNNIKDLRRKGLIIWLHAEPALLLSRLAMDTSRPLLADGKQEVLNKLYEERMPLYAKAADVRIDTGSKSVEEAGKEVLRWYEKVKS